MKFKEHEMQNKPFKWGNLAKEICQDGLTLHKLSHHWISLKMQIYQYQALHDLLAIDTLFHHQT